MNSSDSAEELIKIYLDGISFTLKIAGEGSKNPIAFLMAMQKEKVQIKGKTRLTNMLKTGKQLKIFTIKAEDLKKFSQEAKKYGILYCVLANKKNEKIDGLVDVMVREEDASKVNRIAERFKFADVATIKKEMEKEEKAKVEQLSKKSKDEQMLDELFAEPPKEEKEQTPSNEQSEEKSQSEHSLNTKKNLEENRVNNSRRSVKKELRDIEKELKQKEKLEQKEELFTDKNENAVETNTPKHLKTKEVKKEEQMQENNKAKHLKEPKHFEQQNHNSKRRKRNKRKGQTK